MLLEQQEKGEFKPSGSDDVLSTALQTPEHSGRVRGVGGFVTPSAYFNLPKQRRVRVTKAELIARDRVMSEEFEKMKREMTELKALIASTPKNQSPMFSDKASFDPHKEEPVKRGSKKKAKVVKELQLTDDDDEEECVAIPPPPPPPEILKVI